MSGTGVRPSSRVMMTVWLTSGMVSSCPRTAAPAIADETPGITSYAIPSSEPLYLLRYGAVEGRVPRVEADDHPARLLPPLS